jgi:TerC family integral membrane protein
MRGAMIAVGAALISGVRVDHLRLRRVPHPDRHQDAADQVGGLERPEPQLRGAAGPVACSRPITERYHGERFFVRAGSDASHAPATPGRRCEHDKVVEKPPRSGALLATPLFLALLMVEVTDVIFAVDSIPAIFAITTDPFLVFTSNVFAMLGLRSLYFALAGMIDKFVYLKVSLAVILMVVGVKMMTHTWLKSFLGEHFNFYVLGVVVALLAAGVVASLLRKPPVADGPTSPASGAA